MRCFDTRLRDQQERYKAISSFILADDLPYTVDFHYLEDGIKCSGAWYPILKMTWVQGQSIDAYVRDKLHDTEALVHLRQEFQTMMLKLKANGVAHGDLQHGNILVNSGEIYLVDYDGFYVPELAGRHSNELGHPNYQHPKRTEKYFGPYLDNFAAWLIDFSLLCLIEDPSLWTKFVGGDECLLLRHSDFVNPASSKLIAALKSHKSQKIRDALQKWLAILDMPIESIPSLGDEPGVRLEIETIEKQSDEMKA
ncbi:MAG: hypothetical protein K2X81_01845 [Candidatus Obscuribacterales bacterium]|nr:hypothetical protein [Candidatus Obscuribacterales bacterium]